MHARCWLMVVVLATAACGDDHGSGLAAPDGADDDSVGHDGSEVAADSVAAADTRADTTPDTHTGDDADVQVEVEPEVEPSYRAGYVTVATTAITGQRFKRLIFTGADGQSRLCVEIDTDPFVLPPTRMQLHEGIPCAPPGDDLLFFGGEARIAAGVFAHGSDVTERIVTLGVLVDGDVALTFDGAALSAGAGR